MRNMLLLGAVLVISGTPSWAKQCSGIVLKDSCNVGGECPDGPMYKKGERYDFVGWEVDEGKRAYVVYREGSILADDVKLVPGCKLKPY